MKNELTFYDAQDFDNEDVFAAIVANGLSSKKNLMDCLFRQLRMPDYFGFNWDALYDMLCDLSWIRERRVLILHSDLPALSPDDLSAYLHLLNESVKGWKTSNEHELIVAFPASVRERVAACL